MQFLKSGVKLKDVKDELFFSSFLRIIAKQGKSLIVRPTQFKKVFRKESNKLIIVVVETEV